MNIGTIGPIETIGEDHLSGRFLFVGVHFMRSALPGSSWLQWTTIEEKVNQDCLGQEGHFGFCPTCRTQKRWMVLLPLSSMKEEVLLVTRLVTKSQNWSHTSPTWLPQHSAAARHPIVGPTPKPSSRLWTHYWTSEE